MIRKFVIGSPIDTEAVIREFPAEAGEIPGWERNETEKSLSYSMAPDDIVYGLGETVRGMNKRGWIYEADAQDDPNHTEGRHSLYAAHNFLLIYGKARSFGIFFDNPGMITFDIGYTDQDILKVTFQDFDAAIYLIEAASLKEIVHEFRGIIGRSYIPPKWAFGVGQSRWSYMDEDEVREVVRNYRGNGMPLDAVYLDIDYMDAYKDFTVNEKTFPDFSAFVQEMKDQGIHLVPIIDAGVKIEKGYRVYEEGTARGYFVRKADGQNLVAAVWPGKVHFPDVLNEEARKWFGDQYKVLLDAGIDGFWNDMNEPAVFYTEDHLKEVFEKIREYEGKNLDIRSFFEFRGLVAGISNNPEDYRRFYHDYKGEKIRHDKVHNLFGDYMTRAAGEAFERLSPDKRILMFSRSSYIGMHRYGGVWTGDNSSWWSHILLNLHQLPGLNMAGFLYSGADTGGFGSDATEDLLMRWLELSIFTPLLRNHSAMGTRRQEFYRFKDKNSFRNLLRLRYALIPYLYSEFMKAALNDGMLFEPLSFEYPSDDRAAEVEDQLLVGESIMIAPVYTQNAGGRYVYLPEDMKLLRMRSPKDVDAEEMVAGDHYVPCALNEVLVFIRPGHVLPLGEGVENVEKIDDAKITRIPFRADPDVYELYDDDGVTRL